MCFVNSQNVRDLRQPFGGTKASGTGREGGTWSYEVFCEPKNVGVSLARHHIPHWGLYLSLDAALRPMGKLALAAKITHVPLDVPVGDADGPNRRLPASARDQRPHGDRPPLPRHSGVDTIVRLRRALAGQQRIPHQLRRRSSRASTPATSCRTSSGTCPTPTRAIPALGHLIADMAERDGREEPRATATPRCELEYGTLVPMRYMNADQHFKVISISGWCDWHDLERIRPLRPARCGARSRSATTARWRCSPAARCRTTSPTTAVAPEFMHKRLRPASSSRLDRARGRALEGRRMEDLRRHAADVRRQVLGRRRHARHGECCSACWAGTATHAPGRRSSHALFRQLGHAGRSTRSFPVTSRLPRVELHCRLRSRISHAASRHPLHAQHRARDRHARALPLAGRHHARTARRRGQAGLPDRRHARAGLSRPRTTPWPTARPTTPSCTSTCAWRAGRTDAVKKRIGDALLARVKAHFAPLLRQAARRHHAADRREPRPGLRRQAQQPASPLQQVACPMLATETHPAARRRTAREREVARAAASISPSAFPR